MTGVLAINSVTNVQILTFPVFIYPVCLSIIHITYLLFHCILFERQLHKKQNLGKKVWNKVF